MLCFFCIFYIPRFFKG